MSKAKKIDLQHQAVKAKDARFHDIGRSMAGEYARCARMYGPALADQAWRQLDDYAIGDRSLIASWLEQEVTALRDGGLERAAQAAESRAKELRAEAAR